jgi:hypothetical protein
MFTVPVKVPPVADKVKPVYCVVFSNTPLCDAPTFPSTKPSDELV